MRSSDHNGTSGGYILVIEDDPRVADLVRELLEMEGYGVRCVLSGDAALEAIEGDRPDACILDLMMPGRDGLDVLHALRRDPRTAHLPVIVLTAKADRVTVWKGWQAGCDFYITKPFRPPDLVDALERLLGSAIPA